MGKEVAIVIPVYKQYKDLSLEEKVSFSQSCKVFQAYEICFVTHSGIDVNLYVNTQSDKLKFSTTYFDKSYFEDIAGYNRLLLGYAFYKSFAAYRFMLICQLDVFVFYDHLPYFIEKDYDYIGGPWFENFDMASKESKIVGAGNGGFSLRKVSSFLHVLDLLYLFEKPFSNVRGMLAALASPVLFLRIMKHEWQREKKGYASILPWRFHLYEDIFWARYVCQFFPDFKVGTIPDSISFSFEVNPEVLFDLNGKKLPMATHGWQKYNPDFWMPFIESYGYVLPSANP